VRQTKMVTLSARDSDALAIECPAVRASTPIVGTAGQLIAGNSNWNPNEMMGVGIDYPVVRNWPIRLGGFFTERDIGSAAKVCVIGQTIVDKLFQTTNPIDATIRIRNIPFRVIGVLERKGANMVGEDQDNIVLMPHTTVRKRLQGSDFDDVHAILVSATTMAAMAECEHQIDQLLLERHRITPGEQKDYVVQNTTEIANILGIITGTMTLMLSAIASISLLVGGVGIMNIMLVSVTERTREIGIRMAVGARSSDILRQFLVEAILLSCIGGTIGFALGIAASTGATMLINSMTSGTKWPIVISFPAAAVAILFAAAVGIFFGYYPARRASRLDPIEALRYE
jgi:putative ABC transport system permease protein